MPPSSDRAARVFLEDGPGYPGRWNAPRARRMRLLVPFVVSLLVQVPFPIVRLARLDGSPVDQPMAMVALVLALVGPLALLAARRHPGPVVAIVAAAASANLLLADPGPPYVALAFAIVAAFARGARIWAWSSVAAGWAVTVTIGTLTGAQWRPILVAVTTFGLLVALGLGESLRTRRDRFAQAARAIAARRQSELQAERVRIARELHDVLAHSLSQINVQAGVGLHLADSQPARAVEALANIKESSKIALDEVRTVLGMLRSDPDEPGAPLAPEPDLTRLPALASSMTAAGVAVSLDLDDDIEAPASTQLATYRIVQEALTNVVRHSGASTAAVSVRADAGALVVRVADDGHGRTTADTPDGRGLLGMRERAALLGGTLETASSSGGFTVVATLPVGTTR